MGTHHPIRKTVVAPPPVIPDKLYFRIGDVAKLCNVPAYVLRFWETEFPQLKPNKGGTGQRLYRRRDVEMALRVKTLLYDEGYTIPGARQALKSDAKPEPVPAKTLTFEPREAAPAAPTYDARTTRLTVLRADMQALLETLNQPAQVQPKRAKVQTMRPRNTADSSAPAQLSLERDLF